MGSSSSKSSSSRKFDGSRLNRTKLKLSSLFCGPKSTFELEDCPESTPKSLAPLNGDSQNIIVESSPVEVGNITSIDENVDSFGRNNSIIDESSVEYGALNVQTSPTQLDVSNADEPLLHPPPQDDYARITTSSSPGFLVLESDDDLRNLLHLDVLSISSNFLSRGIAEINSPGLRRNSRSLFWDALSRQRFIRHRDSATIVFETGFADDLESRDSWLLDFSSNLRSDGIGHDLDSFFARHHRRNEQRWLFRSQISERVTADLNEGSRQTTTCASGLHREGTCSCESSFTAEESSNLASISRIAMLADALFEVLDEIHHQSSSLSLSTLSLPAPPSVVDSFPLKYHKKIKCVQSDRSDIQQCYICLADYEEGEKLRVLPCNHDFHVPCIDKWLKEVNRVCPICRHNVCEGAEECSTS